MAYVSKNPKFDSTILKDIGSDTPDNPAAGSDKIVNRNGSIFLRDDSGTEKEIGELPISLTADVTGTLPVANGGTGVTSSSGTGAVVLNDSPSLTTPNIGTPSAGTLTNTTGLPINVGTTGTLPLSRGGTGQTTATPAFDALAPTTTKGDIIASDGTNNVRQAVGADGLILKADSTTSTGLSWGSAAAGTGEVNYIENPDAEANTTGWELYVDAAGSTPVNGTGDSGSANITWTRQSGTVLRGNQSFKLTKDAANRQGEGVSYDFSIKGQDTSKKLKIQFDFKTDEDAAYAAGDLTVYVYDVTNSTLITPVDTSIISGQNIYQTSFNSTTSTSYRLIFHIATTNASAWDAYIDNVIVGPGMTSQGAAIGDWEQTETLSISGITLSSQKVVQRRVGSSLEMRGQLVYGSGTGDFFIPLPSGLTIDTRVLTPANENSQIVGAAQANDSGTFYHGTIVPTTSTTVRINVITSAGSGLSWSNTVPFTWASGNIITFSLTVPIAEWSGKGIVPMLAEDNLSEWQDYTPGDFAGTPPSSTMTLFRAEYRRSGDMFRGRITYAVQTFNYSGSAQASNAVFIDRLIPSNLTINAALIGDDRNGFGKVTGFAQGYYEGFIEYEVVVGAYRCLVNTATPNTALTWGDFGNPSAGTNNGFLTLDFEVPIVEWAGSQNSLVGYSLASETQTGLVSTGEQTFAGEKTFAGVANFTSGIGDVGGTPVNVGSSGVTSTGALSTSTNYDLDRSPSGKGLDLVNFSVQIRVDNNNGTAINTNVALQILDSNDDSVLHTGAINNTNLPSGFDNILMFHTSAILQQPVGNYRCRYIITTPGGGSVAYYYGIRRVNVCAIHLG